MIYLFAYQLDKPKTQVLSEKFSFSMPVSYFIASAAGLLSTLAIKSFFNFPLSNVAAGSISLGSIAAIIVIFEKTWQ